MVCLLWTKQPKITEDRYKHYAYQLTNNTKVLNILLGIDNNEVRLLVTPMNKENEDEDKIADLEKLLESPMNKEEEDKIADLV